MLELITVGFFVVACLIAIQKPGWGLALVMTMYAFEQALQGSSGIFLSKLYLANVAVAVAAGIGAVRAILAQTRPFHGYFSLAWYGIIALFAWALVSLLWTPAREAALGLTTWGLPYFVLFIIVSPFLVDRIQSIQSFLRAFLIMGFVILLLIKINPNFTVKYGRLGVTIDALIRSSPLSIGELGGSVMLIAALYRVGVRSVFFSAIRIGGFLLGVVLSLQSGSRGQVIFAVLLIVVFYPISTKVKNIGNFIGTAIGLLILIPIVLFLASFVLDASELRRWDSDAIAGGSDVRIQNVFDLLNAFLQQPIAWVAGLGFNAFSAITSGVHEPYSHVLFVDVLTELGIPMFVILCSILWLAGRDALWLFRRFADQPVERASISALLALLVYQMLLVNKQGYMWVAVSFFFFIAALPRLRARTEMADAEFEATSDEVDAQYLPHSGEEAPSFQPQYHPAPSQKT